MLNNLLKNSHASRSVYAHAQRGAFAHMHILADYVTLPIR